MSWVSLPDWLRGGSEIYWVEGKAGSGKSTLMELIDDHPGTETALSIWAEQNSGWPVVRASYYFWNSGTEMQKSRVGLLRSLLYQILQKQPDLISIAFPEAFETEKFDLEDPTYSELRRALEKVSIQREKPVNLFLLIDGLDEYDTNGTGQGIDMADLADYFKSLATSPHVKILASSRPLPAFGVAFDKNPKLRLGLN